MIRFNYSKTTSNIHNIQYTSNIHICNKKKNYIYNFIIYRLY